MKYIILLLSLLFSNLICANDGAFYAKGNQLIFIKETDISVKKEILSIKKINNERIEVSVYYEFFNSKDAKTLLVGFEAFAPTGDVDGAPLNGQHPYMRNFTVQLNDRILPYQVAFVSDSLYAKSGKVKSIELKNFKGRTEGSDIDFYYVYHFDAEFKKGLNIVKHTYSYDLSGSIDLNYFFEYVLTAANRWGNKQIDDFTLILDMGEYETFIIDKSFFNDVNAWTINGIGKTEEVIGDASLLTVNDGVKFHIHKGEIIFQKKNFKPAGELFLYALNYLEAHELVYLPFSYNQFPMIDDSISSAQRKMARNLPFARRGYVFKSKDLQTYFETMDWYIPDPNYLPIVENLTESEKEWIEKWK